MLLLKHQMQLLDAGYGHEALELDDIVSRFLSDPKEVFKGVGFKVTLCNENY